MKHVKKAAEASPKGTYNDPFPPLPATPRGSAGPLYTLPTPEFPIGDKNPTLDMQRNSDPSYDEGTGYHVTYGIDGGKADPSTRKLNYDNHTFDNVAQIDHYKATVQANADGKGQQDADAGIPGKGFPFMDDDAVATTLRNFDALNGDARYFRMTEDERIALVNRLYRAGDAGARLRVNQEFDRVNGGNIGSAPEGFSGSDAARIRLGGDGTWNG